MKPRENDLRAVRFERPEFIPVDILINPSCWQHYPQDFLGELMATHAILFPGFKASCEPVVPDFPPWTRAGEAYVDPWGCVWQTTEDGITGVAIEHPLASWDDLADYEVPDPETTNGRGPVDWDVVRDDLQNAKARGELAKGGLDHGHTFLRLCDLRGYENLLFDMSDEQPRLPELIQRLEAFNLAVVNKCVELGVEWISIPEDLGMQVGPMLSPDHFRKYIKPSYQRLIKPAKEAGCVVHMHSDGDIRTLVDDLIDGGVDVINLQDLVNGIDWIRDHLAGRVCIDLDIDRQTITRFGRPAEIDALVREAVEKLGSKQGGLMMIYGLYPGVPLENVTAVMDAMEQYATYYS